MTAGGIIFILIILAIIVPELYIVTFAFVGIAGYGILEFILRLFGKSFDDISGLTEEQIKVAYANYVKSHETPPEDPEGKSGLLAPQLWSVRPMEHNYESFSKKCRESRVFYKKYK